MKFPALHRAGIIVTLAVASMSVMAENSHANESSADSTAAVGELTYLVPSLREMGYRVSEGKRQFASRLSFSPGVGKLGTQNLYVFRMAFNPNSWLGYEIAFGHNPASSAHAMLHTFNVHLRYPLPWRNV